MVPHLGGRAVARIDGRNAGRQHVQQGRLRSAEVERHLVVAVDRHLLEVFVPGLAEVLAQPVLGLLRQKVPGAFHVRGRERLAVMPFDAFPQREAQRLVVVAPLPLGREFRDDGVRVVQRLVLIVDDQIVEDGHERRDRGDGRFLVERTARRRGDTGKLQHPARFLSHRRSGRNRRHRQPDRRQTNPDPHSLLLKFRSYPA